MLEYNMLLSGKYVVKNEEVPRNMIRPALSHFENVGLITVNLQQLLVGDITDNTLVI